MIISILAACTYKSLFINFILFEIMGAELISRKSV